MLFGFVTPGLLAAALYYFVPKLLRTELYSQRLGVVTAILWNMTLVICRRQPRHRLYPGP